jgi:hypothetical protein
MPTVNLSASATVTLDGREVQRSATFACEVDDVTEQTVTVSTTYLPITNGSGTTAANVVFFLVVNTGANDAVIRVTKFGSSPLEYLFFGIPAGGHAIIPGVGTHDLAAGPSRLQVLAARTVTGTTRLIVMTGTHA